MTGADVRAFYTALGVELPGWAHTEAPVRCFADPDAHKREDRDPSCSVNLHSGAFNCHGCGARGGAYDAALARGRSPREAIEVMIAHGLTERRQRDATRTTTSPTSTRITTRARAPQQPRQRPQSASAASLPVTGEQVQEWAERLRRSPALLVRLESERGWSARVLSDLEIGFDGERITVPIWRPTTPPDRLSSADVELQGALRLRVDSSQQPKVIAVSGSRLALLPPAWRAERRVLLVEEPSDMLAARSAGVPAIAVPGANAWRSEWASALDGRTVVVVMDCDRPGRQAAARIGEDLERRGIAVAISDLAPSRHDGYDVSDWLREGNTAAQLLHPAAQHTPGEYWRMTGLLTAHGAPAPRGTAQPGRVSGAIERSIRAGERSWGCRAF